MIFDKQIFRLRKKFYRRTALITFLCYASILNAVQDDEILGRNKQFRFLGRGPGQHLSKPFSPHLRVLSSSEVQVSWLPVITHGGPFTGRYELYIGDEMEYVGHDLEYLAKRLKPGVEYAFKIRACGVELGTCSDFSFPRYATTEAEPRFGVRSGSALTGTYLGKRRIFLVILTAILGPVAIIAFMISVFLFFRYMFYHLRNTPCFDANDPELQFNVYGDGYGIFNDLYKIDKKSPEVSGKCKVPYVRLKSLPDDGVQGPKETESTDSQSISPEEKIKDKNLGKFEKECSHMERVENEEYKEETKEGRSKSLTDEDSSSFSSSSEDEKTEDSEPFCGTGNNKKNKGDVSSSSESTLNPQQKNKTTRKKNRERRTKVRTLSDLDRLPSERASPSDKGVDLDNQGNQTQGTGNQGIVVVIDNSNIFIGGRETACSVAPGLKQRHIKLRLQALVKVLERKRHVTKAYAGGSSPPGNPLVWDVYRRLGYVVDLEDRRGKDEQRVDEQLHLSIYKALLELPPQTLVLATGDGSKGKGSGDTSFPKCAEAALDQGWKVEVHSWKHCTSAEWHKIAAKYRTRLRIHYLDDHLHDITYVEYRGRRTRGSYSESENGQAKDTREIKGKGNDPTQVVSGHQKKDSQWKSSS